ncbi:outer membrane receptor-mediated transport energizer protein TonB family protein [Haemophilus pittmaniae HK 85]|uniref:Outer membrane receptor-mediated transport energizer protein TonB family protein n=1 Tax=Haemophilus pittmaniae HK 85 TaxID=1035188 RepID=F9Q7M5_9PAST|nr:outer membrane receptor-mediated transport energizer protein TonB family protein [Haemophilus pittmaniae HK 85]
MNEQQAKRSLLGLLVSLLVHGLIVGALWWGWQKHEEAANSMPGEISTTISMEMIQGMRMEEPAPEPEPQSEPEPEKQEVVADPTLKPEPEKKKNLRKNRKNQKKSQNQNRKKKW